MLRITIELVPFGRESEKRILAQGTITNDGRGTRTKGNYRFWFSKKEQPYVRYREGTIEGFPRTKRGPWYLLFEVLKKALGK